ncbi:MAG: anthranilate synthase [SAR86 cluster bacterium BACL1 MAG-120920-bin57]|jgi:anthranilate synthase component I|uniref:Anthranilate synthase component 1 n=1 Tax=SAR86 cluster bacterium BACL1 MAG-120920-bin57 TaxID=1655571 RepID=A0A0R2PU62_9GAMM|nr:MAG: anthranilate synthase [SAR86 cluster bacterium BACL1 MAG-120920-bin57]KRO96754.1 MAG: anthranilate synthase [SAR86 cluster bacterium BACL1 MAG-120828-bin5]KRP16835.1 MAG: anthranilate synthase [SAR86 cluster bacterium BACL1 MAG-121128-bin56]
MISKEEYSNFLKQGFSVIPMARQIHAPNESPISLYLKSAKQHNTFLLESVEGGKKWAQYSIIGIDCSDYIKVYGNEIETFIDGRIDRFHSDDPLHEVQMMTMSHKAPLIDNLPRFYGGYVGFFAYESAQYAEKKIASLQTKGSKFQDHMPDILLIKAEKLIVFDNLDQSTQLIFNANPKNTSFEEAQEILNGIESLITPEIEIPSNNFKKPTNQFKFTSNFSKDGYLEAVQTIKNYIAEGDVMQVVLAQDFSANFAGDPFDLYRAIRQLNPSPYMYFLDLDECQIVGASPEILVRLEDSQVTLRPMAGTRKRGQDDAEDLKHKEELLADAKEIAEHLMLIDLGRNDVGKVSKIGTVKVTDKMVVEKYSHVMHIVSNVVGELQDDLHYLDVLKASLPAGTLSGAPKIRAMEIIHELEPSSRGIYGGAIGYIGWNGNIDTAIAIRTAVIKDKIIHVGAGAGIVADSVPENEWLECQQKSKVFVDAMEMIS